MTNYGQEKTLCQPFGIKKSAETKALYIQGYNVATNHLKELLKTESDKPYSIVLDLDETVLDNSPYQVQNVKDGTAFHPKIGMFGFKSCSKSCPRR